VVEHLPSKCAAPSANPSSAKQPPEKKTPKNTTKKTLKRTSKQTFCFQKQLTCLEGRLSGGVYTEHVRGPELAP
jgi:hypothetical protein